MPRPGISIVSPGRVDGRTTISRFLPSRWGILNFLPCTKSPNPTGRAISKSVSDRSNQGWSSTEISMYRCPLVPIPLAGGSPCPCILKRVPSGTPTGTLNRIVRSFRIRPSPLQELQGCLMIRPEPEQFGQSATVSWRKGPILCVWVIRPRPSHVEQREIDEESAAPLPIQGSQVTRDSIVASSSEPLNIASKVMRWRTSKSLPFGSLRLCRPPPKNWVKIESRPSPKISSKLIFKPWKPPPNGSPPGRLWPNVSYCRRCSGLDRIA